MNFINFYNYIGAFIWKSKIEKTFAGKKMRFIPIKRTINNAFGMYALRRNDVKIYGAFPLHFDEEPYIRNKIIVSLI